MTRAVITGTGHSGTAWIARALNLAGIAATHEGIFTLTRRPDPWPAALTADVSLAATPYLAALDVDIVPVVVVRDPLEVLNSFLRGWTFAASCPCHPDTPRAHLDSPLGRFIARHVSLPSAELDATARYVTDWHRLATAIRPDAAVLRIEDLNGEGLAELLDVFDAGHVARYLHELELLPTDYNAHGPTGLNRPPFSWSTLPGSAATDALRGHADRLGY